ncbi:hypothetical protein [Haliangium sp.]|uniref:hypothetical protein n=1 Tax=Haliangium sp. TaxID=2663208 RepID=UPI003D0F8059
MFRTLLFCGLGAALAATSASCIDPDITRFDLRMQERSFMIDTAQWELSGASGAVFPSVPCSADPSICDTTVDMVCGGMLCTGVCGANDMCEMHALVSLRRDVDLYSENPELQTINDQPLVDVRVESVYYTVTENTLNIATPEFTLYMAPQNVFSGDAPEAREVGRIEPIAAMSQKGRTEILVDEVQETSLRSFMSDYRTPFNIIIEAEILVQAGDPIPTGRISTQVGVDASAGL